MLSLLTGVSRPLITLPRGAGIIPRRIGTRIARCDPGYYDLVNLACRISLAASRTPSEILPSPNSPMVLIVDSSRVNWMRRTDSSHSVGRPALARLPPCFFTFRHSDSLMCISVRKYRIRVKRNPPVVACFSSSGIIVKILLDITRWFRKLTLTR